MKLSELENTQTVVLQQTDGKKIYLDLNVSTDTTAIKSFEKSADISNASFDYATGIAVFLALCATGLAYWFGARSFILTKQSFEAVMSQINLSKIEAQNNKDILIEQIKVASQNTENSNMALMKNQTNLQIKEIEANTQLKKIEIKAQLKLEHLTILRKELGLVIIIVEESQQEIYELSASFFESYGNNQTINNTFDEKYMKAFEKLKEKIFFVKKSKEKLLLLLEDSNDEHIKIKKLINAIVCYLMGLFDKLLRNKIINKNDKKRIDVVLNQLRIQSNRLLSSEYDNLFKLHEK